MNKDELAAELPRTVFYLGLDGKVKRASRKRFLECGYKNAKAILLHDSVIVLESMQILPLDSCLHVLKDALRKSRPYTVKAFLKTLHPYYIQRLHL